MSPHHSEDFHPTDALALTTMWRESLEFGTGIVDTNPIEGQVAYLLEVLVPNNTIRVVKEAKRIIGFSASAPESVSALYVRVSHIGQGVGTFLLDLAKAHSSGSLWLYTFASNVRARAFYQRHGFVEGEHGFENMWQLEDVKYRWSRATG